MSYLYCIFTIVKDIYVLTENENKTAYLYKGEYLEYNTRIETFNIKGKQQVGKLLKP